MTLEPQTPKPNRDGGDKKNFWLQFARYSQLAFALPAAVVVGWLIGEALDRWLHTGWLYLVGILLGIAAGFVELIRTDARHKMNRPAEEIGLVPLAELIRDASCRSPSSFSQARDLAWSFAGFLGGARKVPCSA